MLRTFQPRQSGRPATCCKVMTQYSSSMDQRWSVESARGVFSNTHSVSESYSLPGFASVFQVEVLAILEVYRWLERDSSSKRNIAILTDSQAAIKALYSATVQCRSGLNSVDGTLKVNILFYYVYIYFGSNLLPSSVQSYGSIYTKNTNYLN